MTKPSEPLLPPATCLECPAIVPSSSVHENERQGWRLRLAPEFGWECPGCAIPHEDEMRLSELQMTIDANEVKR